MNFIKKILVGIVFFHINTSSSQNTTGFLKSNIQPRIVNKFWSFKADDHNVGGFYFTQNQLSVYIKVNKIGIENYYFTSTSCDQVSAIFDNSKIGTISAGNFLKTASYCYLIEISPDLKKIRLKKSNENETKWQTFYLIPNPSYLK